MRIDSSGNVGIGTSSPNAKVEISAGNFALTQDYNAQWLAGTTVRASIKGTSGDALSFSTRVGGTLTETMLLNSSGNLGLGVTPSAWSSTFKVLDINTTGFVGGSASSANIGENAYFDGTHWRYKTTSEASYYAQLSAEHRWHTAPSGTAGNIVTFTQAMTLDASGNLGIGTTSPVSIVGYTIQTLNNNSSGSATYYQQNGTTVGRAIATSTDFILGAIKAGSNLIFESSNLERMRIDSSGNLLIGTTFAGVTNTKSIVADIGGVGYLVVNHTGTATGSGYQYFGYNGGAIGSITQSGTTAVAYNTSSDYRLKENQAPLTGSGAFIDALQPKTWTWTADGSTGVGFIAHEVQAVSPNSVVGEKDAVDEEGKPVMQAMEYGSAEFIANIIAELQDLRKRVAVLESK
jgi:hypothetical protein